MPRITPSALSDTTADRVMAHRPELLEAWGEPQTCATRSLIDALTGAQGRGSPHACATHRLSVLRVAWPPGSGAGKP